MKQKELKILADWYGGVALELSKNRGWDPFIDSNQLDMLEDKMINEIRVKFERPVNLAFGVYRDNSKWIGQTNSEFFNLDSEGKTKNEARLNAIFNYIREKTN